MAKNLVYLPALELRPPGYSARSQSLYLLLVTLSRKVWMCMYLYVMTWKVCAVDAQIFGYVKFINLVLQSCQFHAASRWLDLCFSKQLIANDNLSVEGQHFQHLLWSMSCNYFIRNVIGRQACWFISKIRKRLVAIGDLNCEFQKEIRRLQEERSYVKSC
jgi:hypothetical protein